MTGWNFADAWEAVADLTPDAPALVQAARRTSWASLDRRADGVAAWLLSLGVVEQDKAALYLYNCPEYLESMFASYKAGLAPVNTNYRYRDGELVYLWDNSDAVAVVFHGRFAERVAEVRLRVPRVRGWLWVDDGSGPCPEWATPYDAAAGSGAARQRPPWGRSGDHLYLLYTGGTTGMPKGVMWRQDDLIQGASATLGLGLDERPDYARFTEAIGGRARVSLYACPLMHGTAGLTSQLALLQGGCAVVLAGRHFDPVEVLDVIEAERVEAVSIVGDVFAKPILAALDAEPGRWDVSSLVAITSSGVMWSEATKRGLLAHNAGMVLADAFSSSEALGMGTSVSGAGADASATARFQLGPNAVVISEDGRLVEPGSGEAGMVGIGGRIPLGYYKDEAKTARTFKVIEGRRYSIPGDWATVDADGTVTLLGRGSGCINTGGEKVYPEEVEEALKTHPAVADAVVVGVPDPTWGEAITALVQAVPGTTVSAADLIGHVKAQLSGYKAPKRLHLVGTIGRSPSGKVDYPRCRAEAVALSSEPGTGADVLG